VGPHAFLYNNGTPVDLGTLGGTLSLGFGINNAGQVVGLAYLSGDQAEHAFLYVPGKGMMDLNSLVGNGSGRELHVATAINDGGQIVGSGSISNGDEHAFLLTPIQPH